VGCALLSDLCAKTGTLDVLAGTSLMLPLLDLRAAKCRTAEQR
jgi:hypothetical protein